tara:strand:- start:523 stop:1539 length:1017 start_codon:yes stop_codon:yes gene_type:complete
MLKDIKSFYDEVNKFEAKNVNDIELFRIKFFSKKGVFSLLFENFKALPNNEKKIIGKAINELKLEAKNKIDYFKIKFKDLNFSGEELDLSRNIVSNSLGSRHPISIVKNEIVEIFNRIGFIISEGPEIEDDWHNFSALNLPEEHPARDMQDTFFIKNPEILLRTHTSSVQVRFMENNTPPIRTVSPGRVYRNEAISSRAHCIFHQIEGLYVDQNVSFADLKQVLLYFAKEMFGEDSKIRLRPSYFPFTEPSAEVDVYWGLKNDDDYRITKGTGWLEIMGCGMVDPAVLKNCGIDPEVYSGYAFGMGVERIAMLKYGVTDLRMFFENDVRFLKQFSSAL